jgi:hypothetical protein
MKSRQGNRRIGALAGSSLLATGLVAGAPGHAQAEKLVVKNTRPSGSGSFADIVRRASRDERRETIVFASKLSGSIDIRGNASRFDGPTFKGPVRIKARPGDPKLRAKGKGAVLNFEDAEESTIDRLRTNGVGLNSYYVDLKVRDSVITGNEVGIGVNSYRDGDLEIRRSSIRKFGIGVSSYYSSSVEIERSTISGNAGLGVNNNTYSHTDIQKSTISGNRGGGVGAGYESSMDVIDSTISGNSSEGDGGGVSGEVDIVHSTITENEAARGGGIYGYYRVTAQDSIVAGNTSRTGDGDCGGERPIKSLGGNVFGSGTACAALADDTVAADAELAPLTKNGGPTRTHLPEKGSPAIDAGLLSRRLDQRGYRIGRSEQPDSGSVERGAKAP